MDSVFKTASEKMEKTISVLIGEFKAIRAGRANPAVLDKIQVDYYGVPTQISQMAAVSVPEPTMLTIQPWDASALKLIEKAIQTSDIGINPQNDGKVIRLVFPSLTEDRRKDICRDIKKMGEDSKVAIRSIRRDCIDKLKAMKKASEITEDDCKLYEKEIQEMTDKRCKELDELTAKKEAELMSV